MISHFDKNVKEEIRSANNIVKNSKDMSTEFIQQLTKSLKEYRDIGKEMREIFNSSDACSICKGKCCQSKESYNNLRDMTILIYEDKLAEFLMITKTSRPNCRGEGCMFKGTNGCIIPSELRSATCISFICENIYKSLPKNIALHLKLIRILFLSKMHEIESLIDYMRDVKYSTEVFWF